MIVDIVQLPRRLKQFNRPDATISSEMVVGYPISGIYRAFGYWDYHDDTCIGIGSQHRLITGKDALFRYKFIEPTKYGLAEYFVLAASPIDIRFPLRSRNTRIYCPWVTITDPETHKLRKFILWANVFDLTRYETEDSIFDAPIESVIAHEIRTFSKENNRPDLADTVKNYPKSYKDVLISEEKMHEDEAVEKLMTLGANIKSYNEMVVDDTPYYWCDATDILRGVNLPERWTDTSVLKCCTILPHFVYGSITVGDLRHLFGLTYDTHAFQRVFNPMDMNAFTEISIFDDRPDLFGVLKYVEHLCYGEWSLSFDNNRHNEFKTYNHLGVCINRDIKHDGKIFEVVEKIIATIKTGYPKMMKTEILRTWGEEVYILIHQENNKIDRFFFDLVSAAVGSRTLIRDYSGSLFV